MREVTVRTEGNSHLSRILIGSGLLSGARELLRVDSFSAVFLLGDSHAASIVKTIVDGCGIPAASVLILDGGESIKDVESLAKVWKFLSSCAADRKSILISVGGGATTDLGGFAAATYMRGIASAFVPTTLLAQVDASIGGKSGINLAGIKNVVGSIVQPTAVLIDPQALATLPERDLRSGFAEILKHGVIEDRAYFAQCTSVPCTAHSSVSLESIIARSCEIKAKIVMSDEREVGARKLLNFGHTIGHAIESHFLQHPDKNMGPLLHGEAIAIGMYAEGVVSNRIGLLAQHELLELQHGIEKVGLPTKLPSPVPPATLEALISADKKKRGGKVYWSLLSSIGQGVFDQEVPNEAVRDAITDIQP